MNHTTNTSEGAPQTTIKVAKTPEGKYEASVVGGAGKTVTPVVADTEFSAVNQLKGKLQAAVRKGQL